jgi:hypothetical protein
MVITQTGSVGPFGEPHRAFYGDRYGLTFPLFEHYDVPLCPRWARKPKDEGRFLGGRPPHGYLIPDAGPHRPRGASGHHWPQPVPARGRVPAGFPSFRWVLRGARIVAASTED